MPRDREEVRAGLLKKGFYHEDGDHDYYFLEAHGLKRAVFTKLSRGSSYRTLDDSILALICRQLHLTKKELMALIDCPMSHEDYLKNLSERGVLVQ